MTARYCTRSSALLRSLIAAMLVFAAIVVASEPAPAWATVGAPESDPAATETTDFGPHISIIPSSEYADDPLHYPDRFLALQLFKGRSADDGSSTLADIDWGASIDPKALLKAIADSKLSIGVFNTGFTGSDGDAADLQSAYGDAGTLGALFRRWITQEKQIAFDSDGDLDEAKAAEVAQKISARDLGDFLTTFAQVNVEGAQPSSNTPFPYGSPYSSSRVAAAFAVVAASEACRAQPQEEGVNQWSSRALVNESEPKLVDKAAGGDEEGPGLAWVVAQDDKTLPEGYYLVCDQSASAEDAALARAVSEPILVSVGMSGVALYAKCDIPTVEKSIVNADDGHGGVTSATADSVSSQMDETVEYCLTGTLPENVMAYTLSSPDGLGHYAMSFVDTLGDALDADEASVAVYLGSKSRTPSAHTADRVFLEPSREGETVTVTKDDHKLTVAIANIFALYKADDSGALASQGYGEKLAINDYAADDESVLYVTYRARVLADAADQSGTAASPALKNSAVLEYSNDPTTEGKGTSAPAITQCYTYGVDLMKQNETEAPLAGAGFSLYKADGSIDAPTDAGDDAEIALFKRSGDGASAPYCYRFVEWHTAVKSGDELAATLDSGYQPTDAGSDGELLYQICPVSPGTAPGGCEGELQWRGLDVGAYTLKETLAPSGYDTIAPYTWTFTADETTESSTLTMTPRGGEEARAFVQSAGFEDGIGELTITDRQGLLLPLTGGAGVRLAIAVGLACIVAAAIIGGLQRRRRRG